MMMTKLRQLIKSYGKETFYEDYNEVYWIRVDNEEINLLEHLVHEHLMDNKQFAYDAKKDWIRDLLYKLEKAGTEDE